MVEKNDFIDGKNDLVINTGDSNNHMNGSFTDGNDSII